MIGQVLERIRFLIEEDIREDNTGVITLGNIAYFESLNNLEGNILMSLVNMEQDTPLRNNPPYSNVSDSQITRHNPKIVLNLFVLFALHRIDSNNPDVELDWLTRIIASLQKKNVFSTADLALPPDGNLQTEKVIFDLYSMSFEQLNHLWGVLGGKYLPSILYKVRLVTVFAPEERNPEEVIRSTERQENVI